MSKLPTATNATRDEKADPLSITNRRGTKSPPRSRLSDNPSFDELDINGDGVLSDEELAPISNRISRSDLDRNRDGVISRDEFTSWRRGTNPGPFADQRKERSTVKTSSGKMRRSAEDDGR